MTKMKKAVAVVATIACTLASVTFPQVAVSAYDLNTAPAVSAITYTAQEKEFIDVIKNGFLTFAPEIDVLRFAKSGLTPEKMQQLYIDTVYDDPSLFYVAKFNHYAWAKDGFGTYTKFVFNDIGYTITKDQYPQYKANLDAAVAKARAYIGAATTQAELAILAHDYIVLNCKYDLPASKINPQASADIKGTAKQAAEYATVYSVLVKGSAVCEGYAAAYKYLVNSFGVQCEIVSSAAMNHAWNMVKIDGNWYHVDATFDDPLLAGKDQFGRVSHDNLLLSDEGIAKTADTTGASANGVHRGWNARNLQGFGVSKIYDNGFWRGSNSNIVKVGGYLYFAKVDSASPAFNPSAYTNDPNYNNIFYNFYTNLYRWDWATGTATPTAVITATWFTFGTENASSKGWTAGSYTSLSAYGNRILFNTAKGLGQFNTATGKTSIIKDLSWYTATTNVTPQPEPQYQGYIYGSYVKNPAESKIYVTLKKSADAADAVYWVGLPAVGS